MPTSRTIKDKINIVDLIVSMGVALRPVGRKTYLGLCPFHADSQPSLDVNADKQLWLCRSCGKGGDVFTFVAMREGISIGQAIAKLAREVGVDGDYRRPEPARTVNADASAPDVPEEALPWLRQQRKAEFEALVLRLQAAEQRCASVSRRVQVKGPEGMRDEDWQLLQAAHTERERVEADIAGFWDQAGFLPLADFLAAYLDATGGDEYVPMTEAEWQVHMRRLHAEPPGARGADLEWLAWLTPPSRAVVEYIRETMAGGITADEVRRAVAWRAENA